MMNNVQWVILVALITIFSILDERTAIDRGDQILAAIKDHGSSCHPQRVIEQKQIKDTYVKWGG